MSLLLHVVVVLPLVLPHPVPSPETDPVERFVVFLLPPESEGREAAGREIEWAQVAGDQGAVKVPPPPSPETEETLTEGKAGDPEPVAAEPVGRSGPPENAFSHIEVDSVVERDPNSAAPVYPEEMLEKSIEGSTFVHYVVDTTGRVDTTSIRIIRTSHPAFARSVRQALIQMRFRPAIQASVKVRQWVEQSFAFKILPRRPPPRDTTDTS